MKIIKHIAIYLLGASIISMSACSSMSNTAKGTAIGAGSGAAVGAGVGAVAGKGKGAAIGAGIGAVVGGVAGALIGKKMDKQAEELRQQLESEQVQVETVNNGEAIKLTFDSGILFATGKADLNSASKVALTKFVGSLQQNVDTDITIEGHTDSTGSDSVNQPLSENRAKSVSSFLSSQGISTQRMTTIGYSSHKPVADNSTADGRTKNRRVDIYITANQKMIQDAQAGILQ